MAPTRPVAGLLAFLVLLAACSSDPGPVVETAEVTTGEVVQTVAAVAELEPAGRVDVTAPVGGEIAELLVADGDEVAAGDPIARLSSESVELQIAQAEAAVEAAGSLAGVTGAGGVGIGGLDLSPIFGAFRSQLDATLPPILEAIEGSTALIEDDDAREAAEERLAEARRSYEDAAGELRQAEQEAAGQAEAATAAQAEAAAAQATAAAAQREQAELALEAAEGRGEDLTIAAPADGVVELGRADGGGGAGVPDLGGLSDQLGGAAGGGATPDVGGLLGGGDGATSSPSGPVAEGVTVTTGQTLVTIYDLSGFTARVEVDEIDIVEVAEDQGVTVLVDAFPDAELRGTVAHVALAPTSGATGGAIFPVTVRLTEVPDEVSLRVGLTASAEIEVRRVDGDAVVPTAALLRRGGQEVVFVVDPAGDAEGSEGGADGGVRTVREVPVEVAALGDDTAAVEGELAAGDEVVTTGVETVADGDQLPNP